MRIVVITQNEPFYLAESLSYLIGILPKHSKIVGCVVTDVSPFGKKETFFQKAKKTYLIFGLKFFTHYAFKYILSKLDRRKNVLNVLKKNQIAPIILTEPINSANSVDKIKMFSPDLLVSILGNQIFKKPILNLAPQGCLNLHTALLPKYRGLMPTFWVLRNNETKTGVSVFFVDEGIDSGPIVVQTEIDIDNRTQEELIIDTKKIGMEAIAKSVDMIQKNEVFIITNDEAKKSYYTFPTRKDVVDFKRKGKKFF